MIASYAEKIISFDRVAVSNPEIKANSIRGTISLTTGEETRSFRLIFTYSEDIEVDERLAGLILTMPVINFTYFARELYLDFPVSVEDRELLGVFLRTNAREVFVNKICRRRYEFIRKEYIPEEVDINAANADGITVLTTPKITSGRYENKAARGSSVVLSSGGKESLLTYGMLKETGTRTFSFFFNESGGHWITAKTSYDFFRDHFADTLKVWSNVDRFYKFMQRQVKILDQNAIMKWADTYPVQLFIFPVYIFSLLPAVLQHGISTIFLGDEFDDPRDMPSYHGLKHYFGVFDQSLDFNKIMSDYLSGIGIGATLTTLVYPVFGNVVEKVLVKRYPELFILQRSCHSCRYKGGKIVPCGHCSKCLGIMLFVHAAQGNPTAIGYDGITDGEFKARVESARMRLDTDELSYMKRVVLDHIRPEDSHVTGMHLLDRERNPGSLIPLEYRKKVIDILSQYTTGTFELKGEEWARIS